MALTQEPQIAILNRSSKLFDILVGVSVSDGANDAFMPVVLNNAGVLDQTITGTGVAAVAQGALPAGSLINLFVNGGVLTARLASAAASPNQFLATGFVVNSYSDTDPITAVLSGRYIYNDGISEFSSSDVGVEVYLSATTAGHVTKTAPSGGGQADQVVGYVVGFTAGTPNLVSIAFGTGVRNFAQLDGVCQIAQGGTAATTATAALTNLLAGSYTINKVLASPPSGGTGNITLRSLVNADLPSDVATSIANDTNVQGSITAQVLTLAWAGTLAAGRLNANVVQGITNDTNVHGVISAQNLTLSWSGFLGLNRGGTGVDLSSSGGSHFVLKQDPSHVITSAALVAGDIPDLSATYDLAGAAATAQTNAEAYTDSKVKTFEATAHLTAGQLLALRASPVNVLPAPTAGTFNRLLKVSAQYKFNTTPFTVGGGDNLGFRYVGDSNAIATVAATGFLDQGASTISLSQQISPYTDTQAAVNGIAIEVHNTGASEWTAGDDDVFLTLLYEVITLH